MKKYSLSFITFIISLTVYFQQSAYGMAIDDNRTKAQELVELITSKKNLYYTLWHDDNLLTEIPRTVKKLASALSAQEIDLLKEYIRPDTQNRLYNVGLITEKDFAINEVTKQQNIYYFIVKYIISVIERAPDAQAIAKEVRFLERVMDRNDADFKGLMLALYRSQNQGRNPLQSEPEVPTEQRKRRQAAVTAAQKITQEARIPEPLPTAKRQRATHQTALQQQALQPRFAPAQLRPVQAPIIYDVYPSSESESDIL